MVKYLSGRSRTVPPAGLTSDRYQYLGVGQAEPNIGNPTVPGPVIPVGQQYQLISVLNFPGERYWIPIGGGLIPGSISIYDEGFVTPAGGVSSITQLNFVGAAISAKGYLNPDSSPGVGVTITVFSPGTQGQVIFNNNNEFTGSSGLIYNNSTNYVGIGSTLPTQRLDVNGNLRLTGTIYDYNNQPGINAQILVKNNFGGVTWVNQDTVRAGAGGTITNIQYHNNAGLVDGADNFVFDYVNSRIGIGSTQPGYLLDVLGYSRFTGQTEINYLRVTGVATVGFASISNSYLGVTTVGYANITNSNLGVTTVGLITATNAYIGVATVGLATISNSYIGVATVGFITAKTGYVGILTVGQINIGITDLVNLNVTGVATIATLGVSGLTTTRNLNVIGVTTTDSLNVVGLTSIKDLKVTGIATFDNQVNINNLNVTGVGTFDNIKIDGNTIATNSGNLNLDSLGGTTQINDTVYVNDTTESTDKDSGSIVTEGGVGIEKNLNVGGNLNVAGITTLASSGGITTAGGDLYVKGNLYVGNDIFYDELFARNGYFTGIVSTKDLNATGISTIATLGVTGLATTKDLIVTGIATIATLKDLYATGISTILTLGVTGLTTTKDLIVTGVSTLSTLGVTGFTTTKDLQVTGIATIATLGVTGLTTTKDLIVTGISTFNGNVIFGDATSDIVSFTSRVGTGITPSTDASLDLGGLNQRWNRIYAQEFVGQISGYASSIAVSSDSTNTARYIPFVDVNAGLTTVRTDDLLVFNPSTNSLGIGTTNPLSITHVQVPSGFTTFGFSVPNGLYVSNGSGFTYPSTASFGVNPGIYNNLTLDTSQTINSSTPGGFNFVIGLRNQLTLSASSTSTDLTRLYTNAIISNVIWSSTAPTTQIIGLTDNIIFGGSSISLANCEGSFTLTGIPASTQTASTVNAPTLYIDNGVSNTTRNVTTWRGNTSNLNIGQGGATPGSNNTTTITNAEYFTNTGFNIIRADGSGSVTNITNLYGLRLGTPSITGTVNITNNWGIYQEWSSQKNYFAGNLGIGIINPTSNLHVVGTSLITGISTFGDKILPTNNGTQDIGSPSQKWATVYANNFDGLFIGNASSATYATSAGIATYATNAGVATSVIGGIASVTSLSVSGITTLGILTVGNVYSTGIITATQFVGSFTGNASSSTYAASAGIATYATSAGIATYATNAGISTNLKGGSASQIPYQTAADTTAFLPTGTSGYLLKSNGAAAPSWVDPSLGFNVDTANYATNAGISTNLKDGIAFQIPYQTAPSTTAFLPNGTAGYILKSNGTSSAPSWIDVTSGFNVASSDYAKNAGIATNLKGGLVGNIPYQSADSTTTFLANATSGWILKSNGVGFAPSWFDPSVGFNVDNANNIRTTATSTDASFYPTFVDSNNVTAANEALYTDGGISYNPSTNILTTTNLYVTGVFYDSNNSPGSAGQVLKSTGTGTFWDTTSDTSQYFKGVVVRGYTLAGYQNSVAYKRVHRVEHASNTTTNLGDILSYYDGYTAGASSSVYAYTFNSYSGTGYIDAGTNINKFNMLTDSNVSLATVMANAKTATSTIRYRFIQCYVFGDTDPEKFVYSTETRSVASTSWANRNSGSTSQNTAYGELVGWFAYSGSGQSLTFSTETWATWSFLDGSIGSGAWKNLSAFNGYIYWKNSSTNLQKLNNYNATTRIIDIGTPVQQEENYHTGEKSGYMAGMYNTTWTSQGGLLDYTSDTWRNMTSLNTNAVMSSGAGAEYGKSAI